MPVFVFKSRQQESARDRTPGEQCVIDDLTEKKVDSFCAILPSRFDHRKSFDVAFSGSMDTCFGELDDTDIVPREVPDDGLRVTRLDKC